MEFTGIGDRAGKLGKVGQPTMIHKRDICPFSESKMIAEAGWWPGADADRARSEDPIGGLCGLASAGE